MLELISLWYMEGIGTLCQTQNRHDSIELILTWLTFIIHIQLYNKGNVFYMVVIFESSERLLEFISKPDVDLNIGNR